MVRLRQKALQRKGRRDRSSPALPPRSAEPRPPTRWMDSIPAPWNAPLRVWRIVGLAVNRARAGFASRSLGRDESLPLPRAVPCLGEGRAACSPCKQRAVLVCARHWDPLVGSHHWLKARVFIPFPLLALFRVCSWVPLVSALGEQQGRGCAGRGLAVPNIQHVSPAAVDVPEALG